MGTKLRRSIIRNGLVVTKEYYAWRAMRQRCNNPNNSKYMYYGGKGIQVCQRWKEFPVFLSDMGMAPTPKHSIDRIDRHGNYEPSNCRWATQLQQSQNSDSAKQFTHKGKTLTVREWEKSLGLSVGALWHRLDDGWALDRALTTSNVSDNRIRSMVSP